MIVADSSVWTSFFRRETTSHTRALIRFVAEGTVLVPDLAITEVLQGCTTERTFEVVRQELSRLPVVPILEVGIAVEAARNCRALRDCGFTVRSTIDTLIATRCIIGGYSLLHNDRDFDGFERHLGLRVVSPSAAA